MTPLRGRKVSGGGGKCPVTAGSGVSPVLATAPCISGTYAAARPGKRHCRRQSVNHGCRRAMSETVLSERQHFTAAAKLAVL